MKSQWFALICVCVLFIASGSRATARDSSGGHEQDSKYQSTVQKGIDYLRSVQNDDGTFGTNAGPGGVALITTALLRQGVPRDHSLVKSSLAYLESMTNAKTGGIYKPDSTHQNYETCLAIMCFSEANQDGKYDELLKAAENYVKNVQWGGPQYSADESDLNYGGAGYGSHERPDLSNTTFLIDALVASGNDEDSEAIQRALTFVSRAQNFENAKNTAPFAAKNPDGGFYYTPAAGGESQAGETDNGGLRSYGSMTYAGLKSMIYAGVSQDDPRVQAALKWLRKNYRLDENPNMGSTGLYYYYHTFAKALAAMDQDFFVDADGTKHDWRRELLDELSKRQQEDGSWVNTDAGRWLENDAPLVTGYALLALSYARPEK